jgi:hypothetical protein
VFLAPCIAVAVSGCCAFGPCDRVTAFAGRVTTADDAPVSGAKVSVFGIHVTTDRNGCFDVGGIDRSSQRLAVEAPGFNSLDVPAKSGVYRLAVLLTPQSDSQQGKVAWSKSSIQLLKPVPGCT